MKRRFCSSLILLFFRAALSLAAQDFGFGFDDEAGTDSGGIVPAVSISGEAAATLLGYGNDFSDGADNIRFGNIFPANSILPLRIPLPKELSISK